MTMKKVEVKTVTFDVDEVQKLLTLAAAAAGFPKYVGIAEAANRMLGKVEQDLEEKLAKVREDEAKEAAAASSQPADDPKGGKK